VLATTLSQDEELHWLALKLIPGLGTRTAGKLIERFRTPQAVFRASRTELEGAGVSGSVRTELSVFGRLSIGRPLTDTRLCKVVTVRAIRCLLHFFAGIDLTAGL